MENNIILMTDSYKASHSKMYPENMTYIESYFESRGGDYTFTIFFGLQYYIKKYLIGQQITQEKIDQAYDFFGKHFGSYNIWDKSVWQHILDKHNGVLPITILAVPEGSLVPTSNILFKIVSNDIKCAKIVNHLETLLMKVWYSISIASNSFLGKEILDSHRLISSKKDNIDYSLIDFGYRGVSSEEQAAIGGAAHLLSFKSTDNIAGIQFLYNYYNCKNMPGFSVPASEHSVACSWGKENEIDYIKNILKQYPTGIVSIVLDTWNIFDACKNLSKDDELKSLIINRKGKLVIRPDSGNASTIIPQLLDILADGFGYSTIEKDDKTYKILPDYLGLLQGDGITIYTMNTLLHVIENAGWSMDNIIFGSGGGLLQNVNRDTIKAAIKSSYVEIDGVGKDIFKDPITASDSKKSKKGQLFLGKHKKFGYKTFNLDELKENEEYQTYSNALKKVYENGKLLIDYTYDDILINIKNDLEMTNNLVNI